MFIRLFLVRLLMSVWNMRGTMGMRGTLFPGIRVMFFLMISLRLVASLPVLLPRPFPLHILIADPLHLFNAPDSVLLHADHIIIGIVVVVCHGILPFLRRSSCFDKKRCCPTAAG